jgi:hypothetical protein
MERRAWDMWVDFARVYGGGLTYGHLDDAAPGVEVKTGSYLVVGDDDAVPGGAQVVRIRADRVVLLRVLPGHADLHRQLLDHRS